MKQICFLICVFFMKIICAGEPINLIWLGGNPSGSWEEDWIHEILSEIESEIRVIVDLDYNVFLDRSIIVVSNPDPKRYPNYFLKYRKQGLKFGIIHLSDEVYTSPHNFYEGALFVLRNYWWKYLGGKRLLFFPLGYKRCFWNDFHGSIKSAYTRKYVWSFAGQITKSTRLSMLESMKKIPNGFLYETSSFNAPNALAAHDYRDLLLESIFVPCPRGNWNLDSFRVSEALECGCIPIVEKTPFDYFQKLLGFYPFLSVDSWEEAPLLIKRLLKNPKELERLRMESYNWWMLYKEILKEDIKTLIGDFEGTEKFEFPTRRSRRKRHRIHSQTYSFLPMAEMTASVS